MNGRRPFSHILFLFFAIHLLFPAIFAAGVKYCDRTHNYAVKIDGVQISPDPVKSGKPAKFILSASTDKRLTGGKFVVEVSLFGLRIHSETHNLCEETSCPVSAGKFALSHSQNLPPFTPPGSYNVRIIMTDSNDKQLSCVTFKLQIVFGSDEDGSAIFDEASTSDGLFESDS